MRLITKTPKPGGPQGHRVFVFLLLCSWGAGAKPVGRVAEAPKSRPFPEEAVRPEWDRGCSDWPPDFDHLRIDIQKIDGDIRVRSRLFLQPEKGESIQALQDSVEKFLTEESSYQKWVLPGINDKPGGGRYFVSLAALRPSFDLPERHHVLQGDYNLKLLWFERDGTTSLIYRDEMAQLPDCPAFDSAQSPDRKARRFIYRMIPREDILQRLVAEIWVYRVAGDALEMRLRVVSRPSTLVYELLPESLARSELQVRGRRIFENFVDFRRLDAFAKLSNEARKGYSPEVLPLKKGP